MEPDPANERIPPQNLEAEQSLLGALLIDRDAVQRSQEILLPDSFGRDAHRRIYEAITALYDRGEAADLVTVSEELSNRGQLEAVGGLDYLASLAAQVPTAANAEYYARIVEEKAVRRRLIQAAAEIARRAFENAEEVEELLDLAERLIFQVAEQRRRRGYVSLREILVETFEQIEYLYENKGHVTGVTTGFTDLDELLSGFHASELVVLAARPSQGKTALLLNMAAAAALKRRVPVAFFSLEMAREQLAQRLLCAEAAVSSHRLRTGFLGADDWPKLSRALSRLSDAPIYIDDTPNMALMELRAKARRMKAELNIGLIFVDYLQLMHTRGRAENRQQEISEISRSLKALAREIQVPVVAISQLSRAVEQRQDRKPQLSDLRESGAIEQDADVVMFIYQHPEQQQANQVELIVAKQRNGPTGSAELLFLKDYGRFVNLDRRAVTG